MFHFLVKYDGWSPARDTLPLSRVFEYTAQSISNEFKPGGELDSDRISQIPALFTSEIGGSRDQLARVGYIVRVRPTGTDLQIEYLLDQEVPPISNARLTEMSGELGIAMFEFSRTHWAIKDVDLFETLLRNQPFQLLGPKVFSINETEDFDDQLVSVMMPFDPRFGDVYITLKRTAVELGLNCLRADDIWEHDAVIQDIVSLIHRSRVVVCDCTGRNPNVFYEIGIAHTLGKDVILITQREDDIPFDLRHLRYIHYLNNSEGLEELSNRLRSRLETLLSKEVS